MNPTEFGNYKAFVEIKSREYDALQKAALDKMNEFAYDFCSVKHTAEDEVDLDEQNISVHAAIDGQDVLLNVQKAVLVIGKGIRVNGYYSDSEDPNDTVDCEEVILGKEIDLEGSLKIFGAILDELEEEEFVDLNWGEDEES